MYLKAGVFDFVVVVFFGFDFVGLLAPAVFGTGCFFGAMFYVDRRERQDYARDLFVSDVKLFDGVNVLLNY